MDIVLKRKFFIMKMIYISPQRLIWVYRKTGFRISAIFCYIFHCTCTKVSLCSGPFSQKVVIKCLFPNFIVFSLDFCNSLSLHLKKNVIVIIDISVNHIFNATAPTIKPLIEVLYV